MLTSTLRHQTRQQARIISRGFAKEIKFGVEGRAAMLRGVDVLADAVQVRNREFEIPSARRIAMCLAVVLGIWIFVSLVNLEYSTGDYSFFRRACSLTWIVH
jgi:hypothetical protein